MDLKKSEIESAKWLGTVVRMEKNTVVTRERDIGGGKKIYMATLGQGEEAGLWVNIKSEVVYSVFDWVKKGDTAYLHRNAVRDAYGHGDGVNQTMTDEDGNKYILIKSPSHIVLAFRGETMICPPSRVLVTPILKQKHEGLIEVIDGSSPYMDKVFTVEQANGEYKKYIGKQVVLSANGGIPIESERNKTLPKPYWWCRESEIVGEYEHIRQSLQEYESNKTKQ